MTETALCNKRCCYLAVSYGPIWQRLTLQFLLRYNFRCQFQWCHVLLLFVTTVYSVDLQHIQRAYITAELQTESKGF
jgi:hypothetical protein